MIFIVPCADPQTALGSLKDMVIHTLPFGVAALSSILERDGLTPLIINDSITPVTPDILIKAAGSESGRPVFGLTSLTLQAKRAKEIFHLIKTTLPGAEVIVGGIHATALPEEFLDAGFDYVFTGEADLVISELARCLAEKKDTSHIPGLIWKDQQGEVVKNAPANLIELKDLPPFPYHFFEKDLAHYDLGAVMSSRGCPYHCIFCSQRTITGATYRTRPVEQVVNEIGILIDKYSIDYITFFDDNFMVNKKWTFELCDNLISRGYNKKARFMCQLRGDAVSDETLGMLKKAGFDTLSFGLETGSERMALVIKKGETVARNKEAVYLAKKYGFSTAGTFIIGFPTETSADRQETISLAMDLPLDIMRVNIATPYPGTPMYDMVKNEITVSDGWENFNVVSPIVTGPFRKLPLPYIPAGANEDELRYLMLWANLRFWLKPKGFSSFFIKKSTFVTRMPDRWYLQPRIVAGIAGLGLTVLLNLLWVGYVALKISLNKHCRKAGP